MTGNMFVTLSSMRALVGPSSSLSRKRQLSWGGAAKPICLRSFGGRGFYAAESGILDLELNMAPNENAGTWEMRVKQLASGMQTMRWMCVDSVD